MKVFLVSFIFFISFPCIADDLKYFIPENYKNFYQKTGDINSDGINDIILVLSKNNEEKFSTIEHPLKRTTLILIGQKDGTFKQLYKNDNVVYFYGFDPNFIDAFVDITIEKGVFSINHYGGFANRWGLSTKFSYIPEKNNFVLSLYEYEIYDKIDNEKIIKNITLTIKELGIIYFSDFDIYKKYF